MLHPVLGRSAIGYYQKMMDLKQYRSPICGSRVSAGDIAWDTSTRKKPNSNSRYSPIHGVDARAIIVHVITVRIGSAPSPTTRIGRLSGRIDIAVCCHDVASLILSTLDTTGCRVI